jgi:hypothetical protein
MESPEETEPVGSHTARTSAPQRRAALQRSRDRWAAVAGLTFIVLGLLDLLTPTRPDPWLPAAEYTRQLAADLTRHQLSLWLGFLGVAAFVVFLAGLVGRIRRFERPGDLYATTLGAAGTVYAAMLLVWLGCYLALVQHGSAPDPDAATLTTLTALVDWIGNTQFLPALVAEITVAAAILATGAFPRWLGWFSAATAAFTLLSLAYYIAIGSGGVLGFADTVGFWLSVAWLLTGSLTLFLRAGEDPPG